MERNNLEYILEQVNEKLEEVYDLWWTIPKEVREELEKLFEDNKGIGHHIYRAKENSHDIDNDDLDRICEICGIEE